MSKVIQKCTALQKEIDAFRPLSPQQESAIQERLQVEWTYNSNAIEGNTLTFGETLFFLREGLTSEGKPLKDYLEAQNHIEAIHGLESILKNKRPLSESLIKELHAVLMRNMDHSIAKGAHGQLVKKKIHPGKYKHQANHVLTLSGRIHHYTDPLHVPDEMQALLSWLNENTHLNPIEQAAEFHYRFVAIHPFDDGNGRMSRLLMNLILMRAGFPPCIIQQAHRKKYIKCLEIADQTEDLYFFKEFIASELAESLQLILDILNGTEQAIHTRLNPSERRAKILELLQGENLSIGEIHSQLRRIPRPTLKADLKALVKEEKLKTSGLGRGVTYAIMRT